MSESECVESLSAIRLLTYYLDAEKEMIGDRLCAAVILLGPIKCPNQHSDSVPRTFAEQVRAVRGIKSMALHIN